ncbi:N-acetylmuramoyl-L-alanine amidase [Planotetraspora kaengkrachanensis]|uniref:N-acetylmuramoyl-L-alanine amidase n=1 Tax=Planotetraspora kaengkrachanensis TaxID=575193 RepID=A0A8J3PXX9_9ACTN|nr:N-acetylmuramoyl-L-alanine amidase [Planotetraspora kaengkrachanensis]GIG83177.1 N-acetylmuramoyl-L-alanine amidase [Planotetraspora kaengkrachanensis]
MTTRLLAAAALALAGLGAASCGGAASTGAAGSQTTTTKPVSATSQVTGVPQKNAGPAAVPTSKAPLSKKKPPLPLAGRVIVIDPGHNGGNFKHPEIINKQVNVLTQWKACDTTGTSTNDGYSEAAFTWDVSNRLAKILKAEGATVKLTRKNNTGAGPCITQRAAIGNQAKADAAISIHGDGAPASAHGFHVIMPQKIHGPVDPVVGASAKLGVAVRNAFHSGTGLPYSTYIGKNALDYRKDLGGLNLSTVPKVFIECGNMRNASEAAKFKSAQFRQRIAESLAKGLRSYLT